jgi:hypothetical protein
LYLSLGEKSGTILVYVQATPVSIPPSTRKFSDIENCDFKMSHSSKVALAAALRSNHEILAAGFSPILREAVVRGASSVVSMPLCDDPSKQISFFPRNRRLSQIFVGECQEWIFTGASLAGLLCSKFSLQFRLFLGDAHLDEGTVFLVPDPGEKVSSIDVRRIDRSMETRVNPEGVLGDASFRKMEEEKPEILTGSTDESASIVCRRLRRIARIS